MKCQHCKIEIPSQFSVALKTNSCPGCGQNIYSEAALDMLAKVINEMSANPTELAKYLIINFQSLIDGSMAPQNDLSEEKANEADISDDEQLKNEDDIAIDPPKKKYIPKPISRAGDTEDRAVFSNNTTDFFKRTGIVPKTSKDLQSAANIIKASDLSQLDNSDGFSDQDPGSDYLEDNSEAPYSTDLDGLFNHHTSQTLELEKLKRLRNQGNGTFKKSE